MAIPRAAEDAWTKEMAKWEQRPVMINGTYVEPIPFANGGRGGAPHQEYPKALYRATLEMGGPKIGSPNLVHDEGQERVAKGQGWFEDQNEAMAAALKQQRDMAELAANRAAQERLMSEKAQAEAARIDEQTMEHLPAIPETPIQRRQPAQATSKDK